MLVIAAIALTLLAFVITCVLGIILNIVRSMLGKPRPLPKRAYWDPNHPRYREAHTIYFPADPPSRG